MPNAHSRLRADNGTSHRKLETTSLELAAVGESGVNASRPTALRSKLGISNFGDASKEL